MTNNIRVLMTGAGAPGGPGIISALKKNKQIKLFIADANSNASGRHISPKIPFYKIPKAEDSSFVDFLLNICLNLKIKIILPLVTRELFKFSLHKSKFLKNNIIIIVSDKNALFLANNKFSFYQHLKNYNIKVPKFYLAKNKLDLIDACTKLNHKRFPIVIKPCIGNGSRGVRILDNRANRFDILFNQKPNSIYSTFDEIINLIGKNKMPDILVTEYLPGEELTIDTIVHNGSILDCLIRTRTSINNGISTAGCFIENQEVFNYIKKIISVTPGLSGPIGFQVKKSSFDEFLLLESNPRLQGTSVAALGLNVNLPLRAINLALGKKSKKITKSSGICFTRYYQEAFYDY